MEYLNSLKNLYGLNEHQLNDLLKTIKINIFQNNVEPTKSKLDILMKQQTSIKNQIPSNNFNSINFRLKNMMGLSNEIKINLK